MQKMIHEILDDVSKAADKQSKIQILRQYNTQALREVLRYGVMPQLKFFTDKSPKYRIDEAPEGMSFNTLFNECRRFYILTRPETEFALSGKITTETRKNQILIQILENIHPREAELLCTIIEGTFAKKYGLNKKLIEEAIPNIFK
jgi:hypothetical protein